MPNMGLELTIRDQESGALLAEPSRCPLIELLLKIFFFYMSRKVEVLKYFGFV